MKVLITGSRDWTNHEIIRSWLSKLQDWGYTTIIEGEARGVDIIAHEEGKKIGFIVEPYPADWKKYGKAAGPIRNKQMLVEGRPDLVVAFHEDIYNNSKGTLNMVKQANKANILVIIVSDKGEDE